MFLDTNNLDPILSELNDSQIEELVLRYCFSDDSVTELIKANNLKCERGKLVKAFPFITTNFKCPYCQNNMVRKILSRTSKLKFAEPFCQQCKHTKSNYCSCFSCKKNEFLQQNFLSDKDIISQFIDALDIKHPLQSITDLLLKDALYLITFLRSSVTITSEGHVGPIKNVPPLAPYDVNIILIHLIERKLITLSPYTKASVFTVVDNEVKELDFMAAKWKVHLENFESTLLQLSNVIENSTWPLKWRHDVKAVWLEIAALECTEFLKYLANERDFDIEITDDLENRLLTLLRKYSVSQCFYFMHDAAREASDNVVKNTISKSEAGNNFIKYCFQNSEKQYEPKEESRPFIIPQSQLSYVFHYEFLKIGDAGFSTTPHHLS